MPFRRLITGGGGGSTGGSIDTIATRNIINGVLSCKWDKTSFAPSLLEQVGDSGVKLNIDSTNPLTLNFADGWDENDQPVGIIKVVTESPSNFNLAARPNRHVVFKAVLNSEEVEFEVEDCYDPNWTSYNNIIPDFGSGYTQVGTRTYAKNGWTVSANSEQSGYECHKALTSSGYWKTFGTTNGYLTLIPPGPAAIAKLWIDFYESGDISNTLEGYDGVDWVVISDAINNGLDTDLVAEESFSAYEQFRIYLQNSFNALLGLDRVLFYERANGIYSKTQNRVLDLTNVPIYTVNLGYATIDEGGKISSLYNIANYNSKYPGGMRVVE